MSSINHYFGFFFKLSSNKYNSETIEYLFYWKIMHFRKNLNTNCSFSSIRIFYNRNRHQHLEVILFFLLLKVHNNVYRLLGVYVSKENENLVNKLINLIESEKLVQDYIKVVTECGNNSSNSSVVIFCTLTMSVTLKKSGNSDWNQGY